MGFTSSLNSCNLIRSSFDKFCLNVSDVGFDREGGDEEELKEKEDNEDDDG